MELTIDRLTPYLINDLKFVTSSGKPAKVHFGTGGLRICKNRITHIGNADNWIRLSENTFLRNYKPVLRPLSDLTTTIKHGDMQFNPMQTLERLAKNDNHNSSGVFLALRLLKITANDADSVQDWVQKERNCCPYWVMQMLFEWHFDVFNLIEAGLAVKKED